jgi:hypothetical protein
MSFSIYHLLYPFSSIFIAIRSDRSQHQNYLLESDVDTTNGFHFCFWLFFWVWLALQMESPFCSMELVVQKN